MQVGHDSPSRASSAQLTHRPEHVHRAGTRDRRSQTANGGAPPTEAASPLPAQATKDKFGGLTAREREVAALIVQGKSNREIAEAMVAGVKTVETYVTRILNKLGFDSRVQIATWAKDKGLV